MKKIQAFTHDSKTVGVPLLGGVPAAGGWGGPGQAKKFKTSTYSQDRTMTKQKNRVAWIGALLLLLAGTSLSAQDLFGEPLLNGNDQLNEAPLFMMPDDLILNPSGGGGLFSIGLLGGAIYQSHNGQFTLLEGTTPCCNFDGGTGLGPVVALRAEYTPDPDGLFGFAARFSMAGEGGSFTSDPEILPILGRENRLEDGTFENDLDVSATTFDFTPLVMVKLLDSDLQLFLSVGPTLSYTLSSQTDVTERIIAPNGLTYNDGTTEKDRVDVTNSLVADSRTSLTGGLDLRYPLNDNLSLASELHYRHPLSAFGELDEEWKAVGFVGTLGLVMGL